MQLFHQPPQRERTQFERSLQRLEQEVLRMGALVEQAFRLGHNCLFKEDLEAYETLRALDKEIDRYYRRIEADCSAMLTLKAPVSQDCRFVSAFMQLVRDLERIADYAEDLAEKSMRLVPYPTHILMADIEGMSEHAQLMLSTSLVALADLDPNAGAYVKRLDDRVDDDYDRIYAALAQQQNQPGVIEPFILMALIIRDLERMADHATNIAQRVSYIITGQRG
ncbi:MULTISPECIES: phosphate signaling complex protein PhoU [Cyanophyceae]|uniref:phosphate signaling complex protein PhoU n=1 Tax=Cyanophyceae TaxID=3028117 RepID=UPI0008104D8F|nr:MULTISPECIES: phosphate signaling complex protein PhoU [Cyanophyceae]ANV87553.1 phosphate transport system regulatory protein PhoU [Picosynechococcus sp. PCC 7117]ANV90710.1 phosphate transport system regulatory protein PhoU [Picosynechococcus sp. PCC 8807]QCS50246.1 phosphate signaling complex protein PhoU [Picosynechococcus sp. PCC 11901]